MVGVDTLPSRMIGRPAISGSVGLFWSASGGRTFGSSGAAPGQSGIGAAAAAKPDAREDVSTSKATKRRGNFINTGVTAEAPAFNSTGPPLQTGLWLWAKELKKSGTVSIKTRHDRCRHH